VVRSHPPFIAGCLRVLLAAIAVVLAAGLAATRVKAQPDWPRRPITLIVSQSAGASPDVFARHLSERLRGVLNQSVIVENKPGAGNAIGAVAAARSAPDGYTFFFATSAALTMNPFLMKNLPYDPLKDFTPVALVTRSHQVIVAHPDFPGRSLAQTIDEIRSNPNKYSIAIDGPRNLSGVIMRILTAKAGLDVVEVPYTNIPVSLQDVVAGRLPIGVFSLSVAESQIRAGNLRAIAGASASGIASMPEVEPIAKTFAGFDYLGWFMVMAPAGTPDAIVNEMHRAISVAIKDPAMIAAAPKLGFELDPNGVGSREDAARFLTRQLELWGATTRQLGLMPE
jgi:tripartite-type tricarboxylate transporter receptor subunit TctC